MQKVMNNGFEMLEKARFTFGCRCQFSGNFAGYYHLHVGTSLLKNFFSSLKKSSGHIIAVSCEMWGWAALLVDGPRDFFVKQSSVAK